jgi:hypothetical protein
MIRLGLDSWRVRYERGVSRICNDMMIPVQ